MLENTLNTSNLGEIPDKRYFTIGEASGLCQVKPHVLRYWEQEFRQLNPARRGKRRYYRRNDIILVRTIRTLLYDKRFTIDGARNQLRSAKPQPPFNKKASGQLAIKKPSGNLAFYQQQVQLVIAELEDLLKMVSVK